MAKATSADRRSTGLKAPRAPEHPAIRLLKEWIADESSAEEETWPVLKAALERDRLSNRKLFRD